jgi:FKBP-type peptidyl-prolyl cis-trans isomerase SlyD
MAFVASFNDDVVRLDFNHPLAGAELQFNVKVVGLREASQEELDHGHAHDEDHHH